MNSKVALITGASRGLGEVLTQGFWGDGYSLCLVARTKSDLENLKASLPHRAHQVCDIRICDLAEKCSVNDLIVYIAAEFPRLDVLVNNAAIHGPIGRFLENDFSAWQQAIQVDVLAPVALCQAAVTVMQKNSGGSIINLSGGGATGPRPNFTAYATAKAALVRFSETLAGEVRELGIRVNCIAPGAMKTAMLGEVLHQGAGLTGEREFAIASKVFTEGGASMERVAELALFLASDVSIGITGKLISAVWDDWEHWPEHLDDLSSSDVYTLRRITGRDRGFAWGDK